MPCTERSSRVPVTHTKTPEIGACCAMRERQEFRSEAARREWSGPRPSG